MIEALYFFAPAGIATLAPPLATRVFGPGRPIDGGARWRGARVLGDHKTWQGLVWGMAAGMLTWYLQAWLYGYPWWRSISVTDYATPLLGVALSGGALLGDLVKSFCKRRARVAPGKAWVPWDQTDHVIGGLALAALVVPLSWWFMLQVLLVYVTLHLVSNLIGFWLGFKRHWI